MTDNMHNIRGKVDVKNAAKSRELFRTPRYSFEPLFDYAPEWFAGDLLDPSAGDGRMIELAIARGNNGKHCLVDIACEEQERWRRNPRLSGVEQHVIDYLSFHPIRRFGALLTNPPFTKAMDFVNHAMTHVDGPICILQSVAWMGTQKRSRWLSEQSGLRWVLNLARRPKWEFDDGKGGASNIWDFAWYVFEPGYTGSPQVDWLFDPDDAPIKRFDTPPADKFCPLVASLIA